MLVAYMKIVEIEVTYHQCLRIKINEFDKNNITILDSITFNRDPNLDNELSNKKYVDGSIVEGTFLRFNQTLENYLKVSVGNYNYNFNKYNKIKITDTTEIKFPSIGGDLLQKRNIKCNNKNIQSRKIDFTKINKNKFADRSFRSNKLTTYR